MSFLKENKIGLLIALAIGAIIAAPPIVFRFSSAYQGFPLLKTNTEAHYMTEVKEVYDGHYGLGNPFFADLKDALYLFPPLGPHLYAWLGKLFGLGIVENIMVLRFIFTSAMAFFIYLFATELTKNKLVGLIAAPFVMLGYSLVDPSHIFTIIRERGSLTHAEFIDYGRPVNPQVSSLFFFSYMYFFWKALWDTGKWWKSGTVSALILGLSFYVYLYTWTFIFSLNAFLFLVFAVKKDWTTVKRIFAVSAGAAIFGIPYVFHTLEVSRHPWYAETVPRFGFVHMREWQVSRLMLGLLVPFLLFFKKFNEKARWFFLAFFLTALFVANEQVVTGIYVYNHHYHWYYSTPLAIVMLSALIVTLLPRPRVVAGLVAILLLYGIANQTYAYRRVLPAALDEQRYAPLIGWLNTKTPKDSTVFASTDITAFLPAVTHNNVNYHGTGIYTLVSNERLFDQYLLYLYLDGVPKEDIRPYLEAHRNDISAFAFGYTYSFLPGHCYGCFPDSVIDDLIKKYETISDDIFADVLRTYPIDYLVWDKQKNPAWQPDRFHFLRIAEFGDLIVYDMRLTVSAQPQTYYPADESGATLCSAGYCEPSPTRVSKMDFDES